MDCIAISKTFQTRDSVVLIPSWLSTDSFPYEEPENRKEICQQSRPPPCRRDHARALDLLELDGVDSLLDLGKGKERDGKGKH